MTELVTEASAPDVSVVVPVWNEEGNVRELVQRLGRVLRAHSLDFELVIVDDGSTDATRSLLRLLAREEPELRAVFLARNFGQEPAVQAGMLATRGRRVVQLDGDLQHPPEEIPKLLAKADEGYQVVYGKRAARKDPWLRVVGSRLLVSSMRVLFGIALPEDVSTFRVLDGELAREIAGLPEKYKFMSALLSWSGASSTAVEVQHDPRKRGESGYNLLKLVAHSLDLLAGFSFRPLRIIGLLGGAFAALGSAYAVFKVAQKLSGVDIQMGYTSLFSAIVIMGSLNLIALSVIGEYVGRIFMQTQGRPVFRTARVEEEVTRESEARRRGGVALGQAVVSMEAGS